jgi:Tol biopolymer transport system component
VTEVNPLVPRDLARVVRRCLSKDPARRYQSCLDLRNDLEEIRGELSGSAGSGRPVVIAPRSSRMRMRGAIIAVLAVGSALVLAPMIFNGSPFGREPSALPITRFHIAPPEGGMFSAAPSAPELSLSPDGRHLAFVATTGDFINRLWVRPLDSVSARALPGTEGAALPFWSPDGRHVGFFAGDRLKKIDVSGGPPQTLAEGLSGGTWNSTGEILFGGHDGLYRVPSQGGETTRVTRIDPSRGEVGHRYPQFLPDGRHFVYLVVAEGIKERGIYTGSLHSDEKKRLLSETSNAEYAAPGYLFFVRESALLAVPFDATRLALMGEPTLVADSVVPAPTARFAPFSIAADVLAYRPGGWSFTTELTWIDRKGHELGTVGSAGLNHEPSLSRDDKRVVFSRSDTNTDIWMIDLSRNVTERLTSHPDVDSLPVWSPDGEHIVYRSSRRGTFDIYRKPSNGISTEELVFASPLAKRPHDWSPDGRFVLFEASNDVWVLPMTGDKNPFPFLSTRFLERQPQLSPNGQWVAFTSDESGAPEVYVREFREGGKRWKVSTRGGFDPKWRRDGKELFYLEPGPPTGTSHVAESSLMAVTVSARPVFEAGPPQACFRVRVPSQWMENIWTYAVNDEGKRFLFSKVTDVKPSLITVELNWREALPR